MSSDTVYDAIRAYLTAQWTATPIRFENEVADASNNPLPPSTPTSWIAMAISGTAYGQQSIGAAEQTDNRWDEEGILWLYVMVPSGTGASLARQHAKALADLFRGTTLLSGSLEFMDAYIGRGAPSTENGNWWEIAVDIEWRRMDA